MLGLQYGYLKKVATDGEFRAETFAEGVSRTKKAVSAYKEQFHEFQE